MEVSASLSFARVTARKMRLVADLCRGLPVQQAHFQLGYSKKKGAKLVSKLLDSAIANAKEKGGIDLDHLVVKKIWVDEGPSFKRFIPRAQGRATEIKKRSSHVHLVLDEVR